MARLTWTPGAAAALRELFDRMSRERPETARRTLEAVLNKAESLIAAPDLGSVYPFVPPLREPVRILDYGGFQVAYTAEGDDIVVLTIFRGSIFLPSPHPLLD